MSNQKTVFLLLLNNLPMLEEIVISIEQATHTLQETVFLEIRYSTIGKYVCVCIGVLFVCIRKLLFRLYCVTYGFYILHEIPKIQQ